MELLEEIDFNPNQVTNLKPLEKTRWSQIQTIDFLDNYISSFNLQRMKMSKYLKKIQTKSNLNYSIFRQERVNLIKL